MPRGKKRATAAAPPPTSSPLPKKRKTSSSTIKDEKILFTSTEVKRKASQKDAKSSNTNVKMLFAL
jgi:hypothetical protein